MSDVGDGAGLSLVVCRRKAFFCESVRLEPLKPKSLSCFFLLHVAFMPWLASLPSSPALPLLNPPLAHL